jgi:dienelactone hydrolase
MLDAQLVLFVNPYTIIKKMKKTTILIFFLTLSFLTYSQKNEISLSSIQDWCHIAAYHICNNGKFVYYEYKSKKGDSLVIISVDRMYRRAFSKAHSAKFSKSSKFLFFLMGDSTILLNLLTNQLNIINNTVNFLIPEDGNGRWIAYIYPNEIRLQDLHTGKHYCYNESKEIIFNKQGTKAIINKRNQLLMLDLRTLNTTIIYKAGDAPFKITFDGDGTQVAFCTSNNEKNSIYVWNPSMPAFSYLIIDSSLCPHNFYISNENYWFANDGKRIFFKLHKKVQNDSIDINLITAKVDIWSYKDKVLQPRQLLSVGQQQQYTTAVDIKSKRLILLENEDSALCENPRAEYSIVTNRTDNWESFWNQEQYSRHNLISTVTGEQFNLFTSNDIVFEQMSPLGKYVIGRDTVRQRFYCFNVKEKRQRCITPKDLPQQDLTYLGKSHSSKYVIAGWLEDDEAFLVYDRYDIWMIDPRGIEEPIIVTAGYGKEHKIVLRFALRFNDLRNVRRGDSIWLSAFEAQTKYNGFFKTKLSKVETVRKGKLFPYLYSTALLFVGEPDAPTKSVDAEVYLLQGQSEKDAPNIFMTTDFSSFTALSEIAPHKDYNWMTADLVQWTTTNGDPVAGILYKPENFDSTKLYPIIFHSYEIYSNQRYQFKVPELSVGGLNIPWYVSRGYLVFIPDIWQYTGKTGKSALSSVTSAADFLTKKYPWINKKKMGIQGHSFGGFTTNYVIANTNIFAAAQASAAPSDCISGYGQIGFGGQSLANVYEVGQFNLGTTPWDSTKIYIENSTIFKVNKISTPLLLMHNKNDGAVPFSQSVELFTAMRRLKKTVWLIQYDDQEHVLEPFSDYSIDFTVRQQQFFDHYLKDAPASEWMTKGIPAKVKGVRSGLSIDSSFMKAE